MVTEAHTVLASSSAGILWPAVGVLIVAVLLAAFLMGHRNSARRRRSAPDPASPQVQQARREMQDPPRQGEGWSTPDEDPEQGHPHR
ncbi:DUF6479 family protein [Streptomyces triticiradicis]|uniref:Uncharacterized protein n=1 Tax=Streptomyces triticiradicis TaxID=2651189 RepID=A0A7J5DHY1_9ACTN|nr:DUF6479 family protein [Streptomyces triticiradicis]KAB1988272.1 hypothetical protein F8144_13750 [Streptomyces triticiradicis]